MTEEVRGVPCRPAHLTAIAFLLLTCLSVPAKQASETSFESTSSTPFCHVFDQTKRLVPPSKSPPVAYVQPSPDPSEPVFTSVLQAIHTHLQSSETVVRLIIPNLLNPLLYPPNACLPVNLISFLHSLRALLRRSANLTVFISWPLALYPRSSILTRLAESLMDGVVSLHPFPHSYSVDSMELESSSSGGCLTEEEKMQGLVKVLKLPVLSERGQSVGSGEDMAFAVGRRRFLIRPFHLPPLESDDPAEKGEEAPGKELEF